MISPLLTTGVDRQRIRSEPLPKRTVCRNKFGRTHCRGVGKNSFIDRHAMLKPDFYSINSSSHYSLRKTQLLSGVKAVVFSVPLSVEQHPDGHFRIRST